MKSLLRLFPYVRRLERQVRSLENYAALLGHPWQPGHYYSPYPSKDDVARALRDPKLGEEGFEGIDMREAEQLEVLEAVISHYRELPFPEKPTPGWRYHLDNPSYGLVDAVMLHGMIRHIRPKRIIEVGSGFSSAAMLDINDRLFEGAMQLTFIDIDFDSLRARCGDLGTGHAVCLEQPVQDVPLETFSQLEAGDVLFIDSSHVSKAGSDVNHLFFRVLPRLAQGVYVHIHDIAWNLEYPREWLENGLAWNEQYLLRAFLMHNEAWKIAFFPPWLQRRHEAHFLESMPRCRCGGGGQIWLRRER